MHLSRLFIKGYRSVDELDLNFKPGKNVVVGRNNAGKSNIVKALNLVLGEGNPTYAKSEAFTDSDFHIWREDGDEEPSVADEAVIWCEITRTPEEKLDYQELYNGRGFYRYTGDYQGGACSVKGGLLPRESHPRDVASMFTAMEPDPGPKSWVSAKAGPDKALEKEFDTCTRFVLLFIAERKSAREVEKNIYFLYRGEDTDWKLSFKAPYRTELLQSAIIPSFRDPSNQLRANAWTWYGKLLQHLTSRTEKTKELAEAMEGVQEVADAIFAEVRDDLAQSALNIAFPGTELHFQFHADVGADLYKGCTIYADDGCRSPLQDKGSGVQSATIIGLFTYYVRNVNVTGSALLCVEEPELYLHPHARRVINGRLDAFVAQGNNQAIITTHSPEFVRSAEDTLNVTLVRKAGGASEAVGVPLKSHKHLLISPSMAEIFFAEKAIFVEGYDEFLLRCVAEEMFGEALDAQNISIIQVSGKNHFKQMVGLALKMGVGAHVLCDLDFLLRDKLAEGKKHDAKPHENITALGLPFFAQQCTCGEQGKQVMADLQKYRDELKKGQEEAFYKAKHVSELGGASLVNLIPDLRKHGIGVLDGEIEHLFKDQTFCSPTNKFDLGKASELHAKLAKGAKLGDLVDVVPLTTFLGSVLGKQGK